MNENKEKREFAQQLEQIAETLTQAVKDNEGRAFILIGTDVKDNKDGESENVQGVIAVGGNGGQVIKGLANFFTEKQTAPLAAEATEFNPCSTAVSPPRKFVEPTKGLTLGRIL